MSLKDAQEKVQNIVTSTTNNNNEHSTSYSPYTHTKTKEVPLELERDIVDALEDARWEREHPELSGAVDTVGGMWILTIFIVISGVIIYAAYTNPMLLLFSLPGVLIYVAIWREIIKRLKEWWNG